MSEKIEIETKVAEREPFDDPFEWFGAWFEEASKLDIAYPNAMSLATVSPNGQPHCRTLLLKDWDLDGFVFYTNYRSMKGEDLGANPRATLQVYWRQLDRQLRIEGEVERLEPEESDEYFASRPRGSQLGAWASEQSRPIESRAALVASYREYEDKFEGEEIPRPPHWGGFRLVPSRFEFWRAGDHRLHDRWEFRPDSDPSNWLRARLNP